VRIGVIRPIAAEFVRDGYGDRPVDAPFGRPGLPGLERPPRQVLGHADDLCGVRSDTYETDVRDILPSVHVPTASLWKPGWDDEAKSLAVYNADLIAGRSSSSSRAAANVIWIEDPEPCVAGRRGVLTSVRREEEDSTAAGQGACSTDVVGSTKQARELGDAHWRELLERHCTTVRALLAPLPRHRGQDDGRRLSGHLSTGRHGRCACAQGICEAVQALGHRGPGRLSHWRDRAHGRRCRRHRRTHRRPRRCAGEALGSLLRLHRP